MTDTSETRNDTPFDTEDVIAYLNEHGVDLYYGQMSLTVPKSALEEARREIAKSPAIENAEVMRSVDKALRRSLPKMLSGRFSKKVADNFCHDLLLWTALKETAAT